MISRLDFLPPLQTMFIRPYFGKIQDTISWSGLRSLLKVWLEGGSIDKGAKEVRRINIWLSEHHRIEGTSTNHVKNLMRAISA